MKKIMMRCLVGAVLGVASVAQADYLYWMCENPSEHVSDWNYAKISVLDSSGANVAYLTLADTGNVEHYANVGTSFYEMYSAVGSTYLQNGYSFAMELYSSDSRVAVSTAYAYADISASFIKTTISAAKPMVFSAPVPEPTSGLLTLCGLALLALRRKQKIA